jgi:hypothetical protein
MENNAPQEQQPELFYDDRFWEQYAGHRLVSDPVTAIVELVANCWDAGAKKGDILWPTTVGDVLEITDDGEGMTKDEFYRRWGTLSYDRTKTQSNTVIVSTGDTKRTRRVFGRNGVGRFAAFCFGSEYLVTTRKHGEEHRFLVKKGRTRPLDFVHLGEGRTEATGTVIHISPTSSGIVSAETIRTELGRRFLTDPSFQVTVNTVRIDFEDIEEKGLDTIPVPVPALGIEMTIKIIDAQRTDRTARQHGVAWHVLGRLVGDCDWKDPEQKSLIDGRRVEARRFTFIVEADILHQLGAVKPDWSGFEEDNEKFQVINEAVQNAVTARLLDATHEKRQEITQSIRRSFAPQVRQLTPLRREKWNAFVEKVAEECPNLTEQELKSVSGVLAKMEVAQSQYALLHKLHDLTPDQIDDLHSILEEWTVDMAKIVLDEIRSRMKLIEELRIKTSLDTTLEVQELQPLFRQGLWIFGPEFETIHFTSNEGMTSVIQEIFGRGDIKGSRNRPDFAIVPDGSVGLYSYPEYDDQGAETGPSKLVIVELKAPNVPIGDAEKAQCWRYVRELLEKGLLTERTKVQGLVLGRTINQVDREERTELSGRVRIQPLDFGTALQRADSRLLKLRDKIKSAPFLQKAGIDNFLEENDADPSELPLTKESAPVSATSV